MDAVQPSADQNSKPAALGSADDTDVKVVVRVRPPNSGVEAGVGTCVDIDGHNSLIVRSADEATSMQFNWVAGPATTQSEFFRVVGRPTVENCLSGFNSSVFAYGQAGSGKTHTMIGELPQGPTAALPANAGLVPCMLCYLWRRIQEVQASMPTTASSCSCTIRDIADAAVGMADQGVSSSSSSPSGSGGLTWLVRCSMLEIHREDIYDLLRPGSGPLNLREDIRKGVHVEGLCETVVGNVRDALAVLHAGIASRQVAATAANAATSRSHCIFTCHIESRLEPQPGLVNVRSSRLHLVDLAGTGRLKTGGMGCLNGNDSGSSNGSSNGHGNIGGALLKETTNINSSLTVLGLVILKLAEQQPHIPYRNSKLTFLLQDSIGGNAKTVIVANVSPSEACLQETLSTLGFATKARKLINKAVVNEDANGDAEALRAENKRLKQELHLARGLMQSGSPAAAVIASQPSVEHEQLAQQVEGQKMQLQQAWQLLSQLEDSNGQLQQALDYSNRERAELERTCVDSRQELAAIQVSLQQTMKENKGWKQRWFKFGKSSREQKAGASPGATAAENHSVASTRPAHSQAASPAKGNASQVVITATSVLAQSGTNGNLPSSVHTSANSSTLALPAAVESPQLCVQQQHFKHILELLSNSLEEIAGFLCSSALTAMFQPGSVAVAAAAVANDQHGAVNLQDLTTSCMAFQQEVPCLQTILHSLWKLAALQRQSCAQDVQPAQQQAAASQTDAVSSCSPASCDSSASVAAGMVTADKKVRPKNNIVPVELHRQLLEERQLTVQLSAQVRHLQQQLALMAQTASSGAGKCAAASSPCSSQQGLPCCRAKQSRQPSQSRPLQVCHAAVQTAAEAAADSNTASGATDTTAQQQHVLVQICVVAGDTANVAAAPATTAAAVTQTADETIAALKQQLANVQQQLEVVTREKAGLQGRFASARTVLAAARCSTSSSLCCSRLPSPQPCFSPLRPLFGESIDEEPGEGSSQHPHSNRSAVSGTPCSSTRSSNSRHDNVATEDDLSQEQVWERHHSNWQQYQEQYEQRQQLARMVHAAIAAQKVDDVTEEGSQQQQQRGSSDRLASQQQGKWLQQGSRASCGLHSITLQGRLSTASSSQSVRSHNDIDDLAATKISHHIQQQLQQGRPRTRRASDGEQHTQLQQQWPEKQQLLQQHASVAAFDLQRRCDSAGLLLVTSTLVAGAEVSAAVLPSPCGSQDSSNSRTSKRSRHSSARLASCKAVSVAAASSNAQDNDCLMEGGDEARSPLQQQQRPEQQQQGPAGPAWRLEDYEEEVQLLTQQLQELVFSNSALKATLQQRDQAFDIQAMRLEQQEHDRVCCESLLLEVNERLAASESGAAAARGEAAWAKGQVVGLLELNGQLQEQLEQQGQDLQELRDQLTKLRGQGAKQQAATCLAGSTVGNLMAASNELAIDAVPAGRVVNAGSSAGGSCTGDFKGCSGLEPGQGQANTLWCSQAGEAEESSKQGGGCPASTAHASGPTDLDCTQQGLQQQQQQQSDGEQQEVAASQGAQLADASASGCAVVATSTYQQPTAAASYPPESVSYGPKRQAQQSKAAASDNGSATTATPQPRHWSSNSTSSSSRSVAKALLLQTARLKQQPGSAEAAASQAALLHHQLETVGLQLQQKHLKVELATVNQRLQQLHEHHWQGVISNLAIQSSLSQCLGQYSTPVAGPVKQHWSAEWPGGLLQHGGAHRQQPYSTGARNKLTRWLAVPWVQAGGSAASATCTANPPASSEHYNVVGSAASSGPSADSQQSTKRCEASGNSAEVPAAQAQSIDSSTPVASAAYCGRVSSRRGGSSNKGSRAGPGTSSSDSDSSSISGLCQDTLADLLSHLQALARQTHEVSTFRAASAVTLAPCKGPAGGMAAATGTDGQGCGAEAVAAAAKLQCNLQVSSAFELEAARGLLHASAAVVEMQKELGTTEKQPCSGRKQQKSRRKRQVAVQQQQEQLAVLPSSPAVARSLLHTFENVGQEGGTVATTQVDNRSIALAQQAGALQKEQFTSSSPAGQQHQQHVEQQQPAQLLRIPAQMEEQQQCITQGLPSAVIADHLQQQQQPLAGCQILQHQLPTPSGQQPDHWSSAAQDVQACVSPTLAYSGATANHAPHNAGANAYQSSPSPTKKLSQQLRRSKKCSFSLLQQSQEHMLGNRTDKHMHQQHTARGDDQQQMYDSLKESRLLQLHRSSKTTLLVPTAAGAICDAGCRMEPMTAATAANDKQPLPVVESNKPVTNTSEGGLGQQSELVAELRGQVVKLQVQLDAMKLTAQVAQQLHYAAMLAALKDCSTNSTSTDMTPAVPADDAYQLGVRASGRDAAGPAAIASQSLLLTSQLRRLQSKCLSQTITIMQLQDQLLRQEVVLKQHGPLTVPSSSMQTPGRGFGSSAGTATAGSSTLRGATGLLFSPRSVAAVSSKAGLLTPRSAAGVSSGSRLLNSVGQNAGALGSMVGPWLDVSSGTGSPSEFGLFSPQGCSVGGKLAKAAVPGCSFGVRHEDFSPSKTMKSALGAQPVLGSGLGGRSHGCRSSNMGVTSPSNLQSVQEGMLLLQGQRQQQSDRQQCTADDIGSTRRKSTRGLKLAITGHLRVAALTRSHQQRRMSVV